ncbi:hypothetical protein CLOM_g8450 [Closterium sp. NIES-68]|nr:hypothetical protein CLOM_g8450 [Closterium sp. NIES-68]GJP67484.1 hypothetical protein CLOP_g24303 [Closterium sp. NIES-67]
MRRFQHAIHGGTLRRQAAALSLSLTPPPRRPSRRAAAHLTIAAAAASHCGGSTAQAGSAHPAIRAHVLTAQIRRGRNAGGSAVRRRMEGDGSALANACETATRATCVTRATYNADGAQSNDAPSEVNGVEQTSVKSAEAEQTDRQDVVDGFLHQVGELLRWSEEQPPAGYRPNVGLCVVNPEGLVLVASRLDQPDTWQMPQGGIDMARGEGLWEAGLRELREETGIAAHSVLRVGEMREWLCYRYPPAVIPRLAQRWGKEWQGQAQRWLLLRFEGCDSEVCLAGLGGESAEFGAWQWMPAARVISMANGLKRPVYTAAFNRFAEIMGKPDWLL